MKKVISVIFLLLILQSSADASLADILSSELSSEDSLFFAYRARFESGTRLLTAFGGEGGICLRASDDEDGDETDDELFFAPDRSEDIKLSLIRCADIEYIMVIRNSKTEYYTLTDDKFYIKELTAALTPVAEIACLRRGKFSTKNAKGAAYNLLNQMKREKRYSFIDRVNSIDNYTFTQLRNTITACADIMRFDCMKPDTDRLMRYILNTNANFRIVSSVPYEEYDGEVKLISAGYIEDIAERIFAVPAPHPYVNELIDRGYCYDNGFFRWKSAFNVSFCTEILDIFGIYDLGSDVYYVTFGDIYTENGISVPEISYAVVEKNGSGFKLLKLDMGGSLPDENELIRYSGADGYAKFAWEEKKILAKSGGLWYNICTFFGRLSREVFFPIKLQKGNR